MFREGQPLFRTINSSFPSTNNNINILKSTMIEIKKKAENMSFNNIPIAIPDGVEINDWLAFNTIGFYNQLFLIYIPISKKCTDQTCPEMTAGLQRQYLWQDEGKTNFINISAPQYISNTFKMIEKYIKDPKYFPEDENLHYSNDFESVIKKIHEKLLSIYAHLYYNHANDLKQCDLLSTIDTCFQHFWNFNDEFKLIQKEQLYPFTSLIE